MAGDRRPPQATSCYYAENPVSLQAASGLRSLEPTMSALPVFTDEQYRGPLADALDDEWHLASRHVNVSTRRHVEDQLLMRHAFDESNTDLQ